jgi:hypothetical protein
MTHMKCFYLNKQTSIINEHIYSQWYRTWTYFISINITTRGHDSHEMFLFEQTSIINEHIHNDIECFYEHISYQ